MTSNTHNIPKISMRDLMNKQVEMSEPNITHIAWVKNQTKQLFSLFFIYFYYL